jgi:Fe-S oxidoreductase
MDREWVRQREALCIEEQPPACTSACPAHVDAREIAERVRRGDLQGGAAILARFVPFPRIIAHVCDRPCEPACVRARLDEPVQIHALELACVEGAASLPGFRRPAPLRHRVAVVGAGLSGMTAAVELARKGYQVVVFEATDRPGGRLLALPEGRLPAAALAADLRALELLGVEVRCGGAVAAGELAVDFDAVYVGTGPDAGAAPAVDPATLATATPKIFAGGGLRRADAPYSPIASVADGRHAAVSIDRLLQGASLTAGREPPGPCASRLFVNTDGVAAAPAVRPADPAGAFAPAEATAAAARCLPCHCLECVKACEYLAHYRSYPRRYVREIYNNDSIVMGQRKANRMVNSCALCGLCADVCPEKLSMAEVCRAARASLVEKGKMPASAHEFALRDLAFSTGERFALARHAPGTTASAALFFPGCQLSASCPEEVARIYDHLRARIPGGVALHLGCCGAPADWAARDDLLRGAVGDIARTWADLGQPRVIAACPSCARLFETHLPGATIDSLWTVLEAIGAPDGARPLAGRELALHDPCSARYDRRAQDAVRSLLAQLGASVRELPGNRARTTCCSYGGLMSFANPEVGEKVVARRIAESDADFVTYCAMCRDNFAGQGKRSVHLLELLTGAAADPAARPAPTFSERHDRRAQLKATLLAEVWGEVGPRPPESVALVLPPSVAATLQRRMILEADVRKVIAHAEATGDRAEDPATGHVIAALRPAHVTFWVEYAEAAGGYAVHDAYSHRMDVQGGADAAPGRPVAAAAGPAGLRCGRCQAELVPGTATAAYLGHSFPVELPRCPMCGRVHVPAALATGKMAQVEQLLEDK